MLLHTVRYLCSLAAAFARLVHELRKALAMAVPARSPIISVRHAATLTASPMGLVASTPLSVRRNMTSVALNKQDHQLLLGQLPPPPVFVPAPCNIVDVEEQKAQNNNDRKKKAAWAAKKRPSMLVIPVTDDANEVAAGWGAAAASEKEANVEVEGDGFCLASKAGPRHAMEDGYAVITDKYGGSEQAFYGVYDGHGGRTAVDFVSERLGRNVLSAIQAAETTTTSSVEEDAVSVAIRAAYLKTDSELLAQQQLQGASGGACATTALVNGGHLYVAHLGDCRAVLSRSGGAAAALTADHTCASEDERARVERDGGYVSRSGSGVWRVQGSLAVSRAFGDAGLKRWVVAEPEVTKVPLSGCEFLVIASDGLWDKVGNQEAVDAVRRSASRAAACRELADMARRRGSRDDVTVMLVDLN
ncbi:hypothetical protein QOZ80_9AG0682160 [Eleusine coracana subsp. coracana]|nr:hypothetical protein QOZ80_9AG0682160 [Eleusine coracana subsp. coracana]